ncbi:hypothetical protein [Rhodopseudomonas palustris]|uniref:hypothetical protein n=1 Tax=Rhodopseudomonas palustris TaxID=1076 RepID=UPI000641D57D|nr:hypothetical protein [Rhodopseudomonas palustris]
MRNTPLLTSTPTHAVKDLAELYAIALVQAERAATSYDRMAASLTDDSDHTKEPVRCVFETLREREQDRVAEIRLRRSTLARKRSVSEVPPAAIENLVPEQELTELADSSLSTPFQAWAISVRHRQRAFVFWTYVAAYATDPELRIAAETLAREALTDADLLRRERRLAWRAERAAKGTDADERNFGEMSSAALIESLLLKEIARWAQVLMPPERERLLSSSGVATADLAAIGTELPGLPDGDTPAEVPRRVVGYAEQLTSMYLDESDRATDQAELELAQTLASSSIARLARLRAFANSLRH